jgi:LPXTG-motif cell wall-anchored protein
MRLASLLAAIVATFALASSVSAQEVRITAPASGATVGPNVTVSIAVTGTTLVPAASATKRDDLHVHYLLDVDPAPYLSGNTPVPAGNPNIVHSGALSNTFENVAAGAHRVNVLLGYADHTAFQPVVDPSVTFTVAAGGGAAQVPAALPRTGEGDPWGMWLILAGMAGVGIGLAVRRRHA